MRGGGARRAERHFRPDAPFGRVSTESDDNTLRTYVVGNYMVRVRPTTPEGPVNLVRRSIDADGILWRL
jgi:hypothetical protein